MRRGLAVVVVGGLVVLLGVLAPGSPAAAVAACDQQLDPARRTVYRYTAPNGDVLPYGQVVVHATAANPHRYCVRVQTGGRTVFLASGDALYRRVGGVCGEQIGARGDPGSRSGPYELTAVVPDRTCFVGTFAIRDGGRWFGVEFMRYNA